ncbi:MAG: HAMP domain-containing histidine kinase [Synechococcaceae cyanobacterium RL_1_2]|nr:HAMP domain-containing histidine kinase [Synechococcaceae cyanobacterium RL_1_2]
MLSNHKIKLLLLITDENNSRLLLDFLNNYYLLEIHRDFGSVSNSFDLCIIDQVCVSTFWRELIAIKHREDSIFSPILLLTTNRQLTLSNYNLWRVIDDIINIPIEKGELLARLAILIRSRILSIQIKEANEQLKDRKQKLSELNHFKTRFLSTTNHDLMNHLSGIIGAVECLQLDDNSSCGEEERELIDLISLSATSMQKLLDELLVIGRAEEGRLEFHPHPMDLQKFCTNLIPQLRLTLRSQQRLNFSIIGQPIGKVSFDQKLLTSLLTNLISNGIKYSPLGTEILVELQYEPNQVVFRIKDEGIGIPVENNNDCLRRFIGGIMWGKLKEVVWAYPSSNKRWIFTMGIFWWKAPIPKEPFLPSHCRSLKFALLKSSDRDAWIDT